MGFVGDGVFDILVVDLVIDLAETGDGVTDSEDERERVIRGERYGISLVAVCFLLLDPFGVCCVSWFSSFGRSVSASAVAVRSIDGDSLGSGVDELLSAVCMNWLSLPWKLVILLTGTSSPANPSVGISLSTLIVMDIQCRAMCDRTRLCDASLDFSPTAFDTVS